MYHSVVSKCSLTKALLSVFKYQWTLPSILRAVLKAFMLEDSQLYTMFYVTVLFGISSGMISVWYIRKGVEGSWGVPNHRFCRHSDVKDFTWYTLELQSATEIGWVCRTFKNKLGRQCSKNHNFEACLCDRCCHGKAIRIKYSKCMCIALFIRFANFIICVSYYIVIWTVWLYHIFPCIINGTTFRKKLRT